MPPQERTEAREHPVAHQIKRAEHSGLLLAFTAAFTFVLFLISTLTFDPAGPNTFFYTMWVVSVVLAVAIFPSWLLIYLGGSDEDQELYSDRGLWHAPADERASERG